MGGFRAVLFDLDGVLIDSYEVWFELLNAAAQEFGCPAITREAFRAAWGQGVDADRERFFPQRGLAEVEAFYHAHFLDHAARLRVDADVPRVFEALAERRVRTALVTNTPAPLAAELASRAGASPDVVVGGTDVARAKPAPDAVLLACRRLRVEPAAALMVGDSAFDERAARSAGAAFAGVGRPGDVSLAGVGGLLDHLDALCVG